MGKQRTFSEGFCGIGAGRIALEKYGWTPHRACEFDPDARMVYEVLHGDPPRGRNILDECIADWLESDFIFLTPPCQSFSMAGQRSGSSDQRGNLMIESLRLLREVRPDCMMIENVPGFRTARNGRDFYRILQLVRSAGYEAVWQTLRTSHFGVPQQRDRIFLVIHRPDQPVDLVSPRSVQNQSTTQSMFDHINQTARQAESLDSILFHPGFSDHDRFTVQSGDPPVREIGPVGWLRGNQVVTGSIPFQDQAVTTTNLQSILQPPESIDDRRYRSTDPLDEKTITTRFRGPDDVARTITRTRHFSVHEPYPNKMIRDQSGRVRQMTPREVFRVQGFDDSTIDSIQSTDLSETVLYGLAGNAVPPPLVNAWAESLPSPLTHDPTSLRSSE